MGRPSTMSAPCIARRRLAAVAIAAALGASAAHAAAVTFIVNSTVDAADAAPGNGACATAASTCTLRAAITEAAFQTANDVLVLVPAGVYKLTLANTGNPCSAGAATGDLDLHTRSGRTTIVAGTSAAATIVDGNG